MSYASVDKVDTMCTIGNVLEEDFVNLPVLGLDTNLASFNFQLPDFDDLSSSQPLKNQGGIPPVQDQEMYNSESLAVKTSPWHESDSGMSDTMSFAASPLGFGNEELPLQHDFLTDFLEDVPASLISEAGEVSLPILDDVNLGLPAVVSQTWQQQDQENEGTPVTQVTFNAKSKRPVRKCVAERKLNVVSLEDSEDSDEEGSKNGSVDEQREIQDLNYFNRPKFTGSARSDIKILKVIKPTSGKGDATADDIMNALDERSKKNARQAKINREKKKAYINGLETDIKNLQEENKSLVAENKQMKNGMNKLEDEVAYLKSILANASPLSGLLKNINNVSEVKLSATITGRKRGPSGDDHTYNLLESQPEKRARLVKENLRKAGVCLHVSEGEACLEFCAHCASMASKTHGRRGNSS